MKKFISKIATISVILALSVPLLGTLPTSAASFLGDVNGDGTISMSDTVALGRFLSGTYALSDPTVADVDDNGIIDVTDQNILSGYLVGAVTGLPYTG